eukprot:66670_1
MKLFDIVLIYYIEWVIWLSIWIVLLITTNKQIETFKLDAICVAAAVGNRRSSQDDIQKHSTKSNVVSSINPSRRASYTAQYHRKSSRRLSLQTAPRKYSLNLRPQSIGYQLRKKKLHLQYAGIIGNILLMLPLFPSLRFMQNDAFIRVNVLLTYVPCFCGTYFYVLDIYLAALKTFSLQHLFNEEKHRNVNIYIQLKSLQNIIQSVTSVMCLFYAISVLGVSISKLSVFWVFTEVSCWILWFLLYRRYKAIKSLRCIIATDLAVANRKNMERRCNVQQSKTTSPTNLDSKSSPSKSICISHGLKIDFGDTSPSKSKVNPSVSPDKSVSLQSAAAQPPSTSYSESSSKSSTPRSSFTRRVSLTKVTIQTNDIAPRESPSLTRTLSSSGKRLFRSVSNTLKSAINIDDTTSEKETLDQLVGIYKEQELTSKYEQSIYTLVNMKNENETKQYIHELMNKLRQVTTIATVQWIFSAMWFSIGGIYLVRKIFLLSLDFSSIAIQFSYDQNQFTPLSFEIAPFLILWIYAIYSGEK